MQFKKGPPKAGPILSAINESAEVADALPCRRAPYDRLGLRRPTAPAAEPAKPAMASTFASGEAGPTSTRPSTCAW